MAFEIRQRTEADYRFFRFQSEASLLESLDHELKIADGVLRFRIFSVDPRSPVVVPPAPTPGGGPPRGPRRPDSDGEDRPVHAETSCAESCVFAMCDRCAAPSGEPSAMAPTPCCPRGTA